MTYFINIVECGCNLSIAAKKIHISQSALSQFVTNFESTEGIQLFNRRNGRLESLTEAGGKIYRFATEIVNRHEEMQSMIHMEALKQKGTFNLGIPSLILRVYFSSISFYKTIRKSTFRLLRMEVMNYVKSWLQGI